jgi:hypothetical protein
MLCTVWDRTDINSIWDEMMRCFHSIKLLIILNLIHHFDSTLYSDLTDERLLSFIQHAELGTRMFIYPVEVRGIFSTRLHFRSEFTVLKYFQLLQKLPQEDHRKHMVVADPEKANIFLIEHYTENFDPPVGTDKQVEKFREIYALKVVNSVITAFPFYNRSGGRDHYFLGVYDKGK